MKFVRKLAAWVLPIAVLLSAPMLAEPRPEGPSAPVPAEEMLAEEPLAAMTVPATLPLGFVENHGQLANEAVRFYVNAGEARFGFAAGHVLIAFGGEGRGTLVETAFDGANPSVPEGRHPLPLRTHYFYGRSPAAWHTDVPSYSEVEYRNLYDGIDLRYRVASEGVKYEFLVAAGADPRAIRIAYSGADGLLVDDAGDLVVRMPAGVVRDTAPVGFQGGDRVPCRFVLRGSHAVGFDCLDRDDARPLVIDPLIYATLLGGTFLDFGRAVAVDDAGNAYVTGDVNSSDFPTTPGAFDRTHAGAFYDAFAAKFSASGSALLWATFLGGSGINDVGLAIAVDATGNVIVGGQTDSADFPVTAGAFDTSLSGSDAFIVKLSPSGDALLFGTFLGGSGGEALEAIVLDAAGNVYATGITQSPDFPTTVGAYDPTFNGGFLDAFVVGLDSGGAVLRFSTFLGGSVVDGGHGIARDAGGNLYVAGPTGSPDFPVTPGAWDTSLGGFGDGFVVKLDPMEAALGYATFLGGDTDGGGEGAFSIALDAAGNAYVAGHTDAADFPTTLGALDRTYGGRTDLFAAKLNETGAALVYGTYIGGAGEDSFPSIRVDSAGRAYLSGQTNSVDFPVTPGAIYPTYRGGPYDAFVMKLNATGTGVIYGTYLGGSQAEQAGGLALDATAAYVVGATNSTDFPATGGSYDATPNGAYDVFLAKLTLAFPITVDTSPSGLLVEVDGVPQTTPHVFDCEPAAVHVLNAPSPQSTTDTRYAFASWSDAGAPSHAITCTAPETYVATYAPTDFLLEVHTDPEGLRFDLNGTPLTAPYAFWCAAGSSHTIAAPSPQGPGPTVYVFIQWSDAGAQSHVITCTTPAAYTAFFDVLHEVTVSTSPPGLQVLVNGTAWTAPHTFLWSEGSNHVVEALSPQVVGNTQYLFSSWSDGGAQFHTITVAAPETLTASFATQHRITAATMPSGLLLRVNAALVLAPYAIWCDDGASVTLDAPSPQGTGPARFAFASWSDGQPQAHPVPCTAPATYTATFRTEYQTIVDTVPASLQVVVDGVAYTAPHLVWCEDGASLLLNAPSPQVAGTTRYVFQGWSDFGAQTHAVGCTQPVNYTAVFGTEYLVTVTTSPPNLEVIVDGVTATAPLTFWWSAGSTHDLDTPTPQGIGATRRVFTSWSDGGPRSHNVTVLGPVTHTATFATEHQVLVDSSPTGLQVFVDGVPYTAPRAFWWPEGSPHDVTTTSAQPGVTGERFLWVSWSDGLPQTHTITVGGPAALTAVFQQQFYLTVTSAYGGASCNVATCWYDALDTAIAQANVTQPGPTGVRYRFSGWTGDATVRLLLPVVMDGPKSVTATWTVEYLLQIISVYGEATGAGWYAAGTPAPFAVAAREVAVGDQRYRFTGWSGDVNSTAIGGTVVMDRPKTLVANWEELNFLEESWTVWLLPLVVAVMLAFLFLWLRRRKRKPEEAPQDAAPGGAKASPDLEEDLDLNGGTKG